MTSPKHVRIGDLTVANDAPLTIIAGPTGPLTSMSAKIGVKAGKAW